MKRLKEKKEKRKKFDLSFLWQHGRSLRENDFFGKGHLQVSPLHGSELQWRHLHEQHIIVSFMAPFQVFL